MNPGLSLAIFLVRFYVNLRRHQCSPELRDVGFFDEIEPVADQSSPSSKLQQKGSIIPAKPAMHHLCSWQESPERNAED